MTLNDPFARLPVVPSFDVRSEDARDGMPLKPPQLSGLFGVPGGEDRSPQLSWSGAPDGTKSYSVTMYDPDAPTGSGFWHWALVGVPASVSALPGGSGDETRVSAGAFHLAGDAGQPRYVGAAPPAGHGTHRYFIVVHALDTADLGIPPTATPAFLGFVMANHILARAVMVPTAETAG